MHLRLRAPRCPTTLRRNDRKDGEIKIDRQREEREEHLSTGRAQVSRVYNTRVVEERRDVFVLSKACPRGFFQKRGALYEISYSSLHRPLPSPPSPSFRGAHFSPTFHLPLEGETPGQDRDRESV